MKSVFIFIFLFFITFLNIEAQWTRSNQGIGNGDINVLDFEMINNKLFIATYINNTFYSTNNGISWEILIEDAFTDAISFEKINNSFFLITKKQNIFISNDSGNTWQKTNYEYLDGGFIYSSCVLDSSLFIVEISRGITFSKDYGQTWEKINGELPTTLVYNLESYKGIIYACTQEGLFVSNDRCNSWEKIYNNLVNTINFKNDEIYIGTYSYGILKSEDSGKTWVELNNGLSILNITSIDFVKPSFIFDDYIVIGTKGNYPMGSGASGIYISTDKGNTWLQRKSGLTFKGNNGFTPGVFKFYTISDTILVGTEGGIYRAAIQEIINGVGIKDIDIYKSMLFPNPVCDELTISQIPYGVVSYEIFDIFGNRVLSLETIHELPLQIDVSMLTPGLYFLKLNNQPPVKFIKL